MKKLMFVLAAAVTGSVFASIAYQGQLRDAKGLPLTGQGPTMNITYSLYTDPSNDGDALIWRKQVISTIDTNGLFTVELDGNSAEEVSFYKGNPTIDQAVTWAGVNGRHVYIGLNVENSAGEIRPRQKLLDVPYAGFAKDVSRASGDFTVIGAATLKGSLGVLDQATFEKGVEIGGNLKVSGNLTISNGAQINGFNASSYEDLMVNGYQIFPRGMIMMWYGDAEAVPYGWAICDGSTVTIEQADGNKQTLTLPNLCNRFIVGAGKNYAKGETGGESKVTLKEAEMPNHRHMYLGDDQLGNAKRPPEYDWKDSFWVGGYDADSDPSGAARCYYTSSAGGDTNRVDRATVSHENRPPYFALYYIMKL